jgi:hypothetical protein
MLQGSKDCAMLGSIDFHQRFLAAWGRPEGNGRRFGTFPAGLA